MQIGCSSCGGSTGPGVFGRAGLCETCFSERAIEPVIPSAEQLELYRNTYRMGVGFGINYDLLGALQFRVLTAAGLRGHHRLLDIGAGPLRAGRLFIVYLDPDCYYGLDIRVDLMAGGAMYELGEGLIAMKRPRFTATEDFTVPGDVKFDFVLAHSLVGHLPLEKIEQLFTAVAGVLTPEGKFFFSYRHGTKDSLLKEWQYPEHVTYTLATMMRLAETHGLTGFEGLQPFECQIPGIAEHSWAVVRKRS